MSKVNPNIANRMSKLSSSSVFSSNAAGNFALGGAMAAGMLVAPVITLIAAGVTALFRSQSRSEERQHELCSAFCEQWKQSWIQFDKQKDFFKALLGWSLNGYLRCARDLGIAYYNGDGVNKDKKAAYEYFDIIVGNGLGEEDGWNDFLATFYATLFVEDRYNVAEALEVAIDECGNDDIIAKLNSVVSAARDSNLPDSTYKSRLRSAKKKIDGILASDYSFLDNW